MEYHHKMLPMYCRVCGQRLVKREKKECYECKAFAVYLHIAFTINILTDNPQVHPEHFCHCCHHSMQRVISARAGAVHHKCALTPFVWAVHTNEGWKVYTINILLRNIMYCRCVSTSMSVQRVMQESSQLAEVINQASHLTSSIVHLLKIAPSSSLLT